MAQPIASIIIPLIIILPLIVFWLWMAWDLGGNDNLSRSEKFYWLLYYTMAKCVTSMQKSCSLFSKSLT